MANRLCKGVSAACDCLKAPINDKHTYLRRAKDFVETQVVAPCTACTLAIPVQTTGPLY